MKRKRNDLEGPLNAKKCYSVNICVYVRTVVGELPSVTFVCLFVC